MLDLGVLGLSIKVDTGNAKTQLQDFLKDKQTQHKAKISNLVSTAKNSIAGAGIAIGVKAADALGEMVTKTTETTDRVDKMSQKIGLSKEGFQEWIGVCNQSGVNVCALRMV